MYGAIRDDLVASIDDLSDLSSKVSFNGVSDCASNWHFDRREARFEFNLSLGDCDMARKIVARNEAKFIRFSNRVSFSGGPIKQAQVRKAKWPLLRVVHIRD